MSQAEGSVIGEEPEQMALEAQRMSSVCISQSQRQSFLMNGLEGLLRFAVEVLCEMRLSHTITSWLHTSALMRTG